MGAGTSELDAIAEKYDIPQMAKARNVVRNIFIVLDNGGVFWDPISRTQFGVRCHEPVSTTHKATTCADIQRHAPSFPKFSLQVVVDSCVVHVQSNM